MWLAGTYRSQTGPSGDPLIANSSFAEQQNKYFKKLKPAAVHMKQTHLLWLVRFLLYSRWKHKDDFFVQRNAMTLLQRSESGQGGANARVDDKIAPATQPDVARILNSNVR